MSDYDSAKSSSGVSREKLQPIRDLINRRDRSTHVVYVYGDGGTGKSFWLRTLQAEYASHHDVACSKINDLYHSDVNSNSKIEERLGESMEDSERREFTAWEKARRGFRTIRGTGKPRAELELDRQKPEIAFAQSLNKVTEHRRGLVLFDTVERLQHEPDDVLRVCDLSDDRGTVKAWLFGQLALWKNCVTILAGRPDPVFQSSLQAASAEWDGVTYHEIKLEGFKGKELQEYFALEEQEHPEVAELWDNSLREQFGKAAEGRPILLDLAIDISLHMTGDEFEEFRTAVSTNPGIHGLEQMLITWLTAPNEITPDLRTLMRYLAIARKGLDGELLSAVSGWSRTRCDEMLTHIRERRFVRIRPEDMRVFLHDEVYAWLDTFLLSGDIEHVRNNITKKFIEWYAHRANQAETEEKRDTLCVDSLVYRLRSNPQKAYDWYAELDDEAIRGAEIGLDMRLRTEMLGFLNSESPIDLNALPKDDQLRRLIAADTAARWVKRYMARGQYDLAIQVGTQVFQSEKLLPTNSFFLLSRADLAVYFGQALMLVGRYSEGVKVLQDALNGMERKAKPEVLVEQHKGLSDSRRRNRILGRGHNNLGYSYWLDYGHLALARKEFESARTYLEASGDIEEVANTFDNEGRVESELGHTNKAQTHIMMGLDKRKVRGRKYRIALSMNSRAITFIETVPSNAITLAKRALKECIDLGTSRGIGLCYITLGQASRAYGRNWKEDIITPEQGEDYFLDGLEYLGLAYTIFGGSVQQTAVRSRIPDAIVDEPVRLIEATNEIGCTFRDRAELLRSWDPGSPDNIFTLENAEQKAIEYLSESIELAEKKLRWRQYADSCEDLAHTYLEMGELGNAEHWLTEARRRVPSSHQYSPTGLAKLADEERIEEFYRIMGKIEFRTGHLVFAKKEAGSSPRGANDLVEVVTHYALAAMYFEAFSPDEVRLGRTFKAAHARLQAYPHHVRAQVREQVARQAKEDYSMEPSRMIQFLEKTLVCRSK